MFFSLPEIFLNEITTHLITHVCIKFQFNNDINKRLKKGPGRACIKVGQNNRGVEIRWDTRHKTRTSGHPLKNELSEFKASKLDMKIKSGSLFQ